MNNGHGQFSTTDAKKYIADLVPETLSNHNIDICDVCGGEVEANPMKAHTCYDCYREQLTAEIAADMEILDGWQDDQEQTTIERLEREQKSRAQLEDYFGKSVIASDDWVRRHMLS